MSTPITICGNTTGEPDLKFGASGVARCSFTIAVNEREKDSNGNWVDGPATFYRCTAWRQLAENVAETCGAEKSTRLVVHGRFKAREYESNGEKRLSLDVEVEHVGPDLRFQTAKVARVNRSSGGFGDRRPTGTDQIQTGGADDPWGAQPANVGAGQDESEPPF